MTACLNQKQIPNGFYASALSTALPPLLSHLTGTPPCPEAPKMARPYFSPRLRSAFSNNRLWR